MTVLLNNTNVVNIQPHPRNQVPTIQQLLSVGKRKTQVSFTSQFNTANPNVGTNGTNFLIETHPDDDENNDIIDFITQPVNSGSNVAKVHDDVEIIGTPIIPKTVLDPQYQLVPTFSSHQILKPILKF